MRSKLLCCDLRVSLNIGKNCGAPLGRCGILVFSRIAVNFECCMGYFLEYKSNLRVLIILMNMFKYYHLIGSEIETEESLIFFLIFFCPEENKEFKHPKVIKSGTADCL